MDSSAQSGQNAPAQSVAQPTVPAAPPDQTADPAQSAQPLAADQTQQVASTQPVQPSAQKTSVTISGNKEAGPAAVVLESADASEDDENDIKVAPQEAQAPGVGQQGGAESQEAVELQPAVPEVAVENTEIEKIVEATPDQEKPDIPKEVSDAGVTHSGPGIIVAPKNNFGITEIPVSYEQAAIEEKQTDLHASKHWLMGVVMYVWRRINPELGKEKKGKKAVTQPKKEPVQTVASVATPAPVVQPENSESQKEGVSV